jgi:hypothetical protein
LSPNRRSLRDAPAGAEQAAEKLNFAKSSKTGSRQNAPGTICGASVMVCYPLIFDPFALHSGFFRSL